MARAKRKTVAQQVVATAGIGLPAPVRQVAASRWGAPLAIAIVLGLIGTGVATVDWDGWMPHLKINKERAQEVRQSIRQEVDELAKREEPKPEPKPMEKLGNEVRDEVKQIGARIFKDPAR